MLTLYWLCFAIGGVFVLLAILGGFDGVDLGDHDLGIHMDSDLEWSDTVDRPTPNFSRQTAPWYAWWSILKTLRFWTFGLCFFGLTGLVLSNLSVPLSPLLVSIVSGLMGATCGGLVAGSLRVLRQRQADSLVRSTDLVGLTGSVEIPFDKDSRGKVRLQVKGTLIDSIAYTNDDRALNLGDRVLVIGMEHNRVWVVAADSLNGDPQPLNRKSGSPD